MWDRLMELGEKRREHGHLLKETLQLSLHKSHMEALTLKRETLKALLDLDTKKNVVSQTIYEWGDKPGSQLACSLRVKKSTSLISKIKTASGDLVHASPQIATLFREFYANL